MPVKLQGQVLGLQLEYNDNVKQLTIQARGGQKLTPAGQLAVLAVLDTYYNSTLSAAQKAALPDFLLSATAGSVIAAVAPGTEPALAALLVTAVGTNTTRG